MDGPFSFPSKSATETQRHRDNFFKCRWAMKEILLVFGIGLLFPLAALMGIHAAQVQQFTPTPEWLYWALQIFGIAFVLWRLRPSLLKGIALVFGYLLVYNLLALNGAFAIMNYYGSAH